VGCVSGFWLRRTSQKSSKPHRYMAVEVAVEGTNVGCNGSSFDSVLQTISRVQELSRPEEQCYRSPGFW
jgi:hypothetical protein